MEIRDFLLDRKLDSYVKSNFNVVNQIYSDASLIEKLSTIIEQLLSNVKRNILIFLGGATASGKTIMTDRLIKNLSSNKLNVCRICTDDYVKDTRSIRREKEKKIIEFVNGDLGSEYYEKELKKNLMQAKYNLGALISNIYSELMPNIDVTKKKVILVEGDILLDIPCDLFVFLNVSDDVRKQRFLIRNVKERGYSYQEAKEKFRDIYEYQHLAITSHMLEQADLVISYVNEKYYLFTKRKFNDSEVQLLTSTREYLLNFAYCERDCVHLLNTEKWFCLIWKYLFKSPPPLLGRVSALLHDADRVLNKKNQYPEYFKVENCAKLSTVEVYKKNKKYHSAWCADLAATILMEKLQFKDKDFVENIRGIICKLEPMDRDSKFGDIVFTLDQADAYSFFQKNIEHYRKTRNDTEFNTKICYTKERLNDELKDVPEIDELTNWIKVKYKIDIWEK